MAVHLPSRATWACVLVGASALLVSSLAPAGRSVRCAAALVQGSTTWYVDDDGDPANGCTSWDDACPDLQTALGFAAPGDEIWVASGTYTPDAGTGDRAASFELISGLAILGGFAGTEATLEQRAGLFEQTVLTGDLDGDDLPEDFPGGPTFADNSYHVVIAGSVDATAVLDGFTITAGNADTAPAHQTGGGLDLLGASPTVRRCRFVGNTATYGGALHDDNGGTTLVDCLFSGNAASNFGGAVDCFSTNSQFVNCIFTGNTALDGAAVHCDFGIVTLTNCTISANTAANRGGGVYLYTGVTLELANCILWDNAATLGGVESAQLYLTAAGNLPVVNQTCLEGWSGQHGGVGNLGSDPFFADPDQRDYRLQARSPCVDAGSNAAVPEGITTDHAGRPRFVDGDGDGSVMVDLGAYEHQACPADIDGDGAVTVDDLTLLILEWGCTDPPGPCAADVDGSGLVDADDLVAVVLAWGGCR
ncbi:MAG: choice-of-anchor Q domain-containing protein [Planctomycetota bacterium]|jgi:hypothetical protein